MNFKQFQTVSIAIIAFHELIDGIAFDKSAYRMIGEIELVNVKITVETD